MGYPKTISKGLLLYKIRSIVPSDSCDIKLHLYLNCVKQFSMFPPLNGACHWKVFQDEIWF